MNTELKDVIQSLGESFEQFKLANDLRLKSLEKNSNADVLLSEKVDRINAELTKISDLKSQIEGLEKLAARPEFGGGESAENADKKAYHAAFDKWFRKGVDAGLADLQIKAGLSTSSDADGGFTVPEQYDQTIDRVAQTVSAMRRLATTISISTDTYKKLVSQGGAVAGWVAEKGARDETDTPTLKEIAINTKEIYANPFATQALLDDSFVNIEQWLADEVSISFADQEGDAFIDGNGVEKPRGILSYDKVANASYSFGKTGFITSGHASLLNDQDKLIKLQHALKSVYRTGASWLMSDATLENVRTFKDGQGNYIWRPGLEQDAPSLLLGKPVEIDDNMPAIGSNAYPVAFGNFKRAYLIVDRAGVRVLRDPYTNKPYVGFYTTKRVGGGVVNFEAIKLLKIAA